VHRGVVTGANRFFVLTRKDAAAFGLSQWCRPVVSSAEEVLTSGGSLHDNAETRLLLNVPKGARRHAHPELDAYLKSGEQAVCGDVVCQRYVTRHRSPWWHLGNVQSPPIVASYMARQAPAFALNPEGLAILNIAHGLYPVSPMTPEQLAALVIHLNDVRSSFRGCGRTYHGGLEKFEPRELEALPIPAHGPWTD
jgi:hypothetical protein